jgi:transposase
MSGCAQQQSCGELAALREELAAARAQNAELVAALRDSGRERDRLRHQLDQCLRRLYGRRSEKTDPRQLFLDALLLEAIEANPPPAAADGAVPEPETLIPVPGYERRAGHGRLEIPEHLEQRVILVDVPDEEKVCPVTGEPMVVARHEDTRKLEFVASRLICNVYRRPVYVSPDRSARVPPLVPSLPAFAADRLKADVGLLGFAVVAKFADALPLYRQQAIWRREGFELSATTLDGWVLHVAAALQPLYPLHKAEVLATGYAGSDDTPVTVLVPGEAGSDTGRFRCALGYRDGGLAPLVIFEFTMDRAGRNIAAFFALYHGWLQADAYSGYGALFGLGQAIEVGCWAHARRYFERALQSAPAEAAEVMGQMRRLFHLESTLQEREARPEEVLATRQAESRPIVEALFGRLGQLAPEALPRSPLGEACTYALNQQAALMRFLEDPRLRLDNNLVEQQMKAVATGRKNWLFAGSPEGGRAAATLLTFVRTCISLEVNPADWLSDVLRRLPSCPPEDLHTLLPQHWQPGPPLPDRIVTPPLPRRLHRIARPQRK